MNKFLFALVFIVFSSTAFAQDFDERYELVNLGRKVNTGYHEGAPVVSADGKTLYFFVHNHPENTYGREGSQDIWYSELGEDGKWGEAHHLDKSINQHHSNQVFTVLPDGTLFIRGGSSKNSKGFSFIRHSGNSWSNPEELDVEDFKKMNQGKFYGATMSSDGQHMLLYFSEKENSAFSDIYYSKRQENNKWSRPVILPGSINTSRDDFAPYLASDDKTMYYSSNRKDMGLGNADIYQVTRLDDTWLKWSAPKNLGRPLNTSAFDSYMSIDSYGNVFTAQSGNTIDGGNLDIFGLKLKTIHVKLRGMVLDEKSDQGISATLYLIDGNQKDTISADFGDGYTAKIKDERTYKVNVVAEGYYSTSGTVAVKRMFRDTIYIQDFMLKPIKRNVLLTGTVYDNKTQEPIIAKVDIVLKNDPQVKFNKRTNEGYYENELEKKGWYIISASAEGFLSTTDSIAYQDDEIAMLTRDLYLEPIEIGTTVRLENIFFDFDKTTLKSESYVELDKVVTFLTDNPSLEIEISGHTDSKGSDDYNLNLSQGRAQAVVDYLISQGIDEYRLTAQGYGETVPLQTNDTEEGRAYNRRVEFKVLKT